MSTKKESDSLGDWLTLDEERDWRAYLRMVTAVQVRTAHDLAALGLSEPDYEVLSTLSERRDGTSTLHEQAAKMGWSRSRLSRHASRMEARGLIHRAPDPADGRGCLLAITPTGWQTLREAAPTTSHPCAGTSSTASHPMNSPPSATSRASCRRTSRQCRTRSPNRPPLGWPRSRRQHASVLRTLVGQ